MVLGSPKAICDGKHPEAGKKNQARKSRHKTMELSPLNPPEKRRCPLTDEVGIRRGRNTPAWRKPGVLSEP
jgi:hypothetical protein